MELGDVEEISARTSCQRMEKTTRWFHNQIKAAWKHLDCCLKVLPSQGSCKIKLVTSSLHTFSVEMMLGVQLDDSETFLNTV